MEPAWLREGFLTEPKYNENVYQRWKWGQRPGRREEAIPRSAGKEQCSAGFEVGERCKRQKWLLGVHQKQKEYQPKCDQLLNGVGEKDHGKQGTFSAPVFSS